MKASLFPLTTFSLIVTLASCATPERAAQLAENQLISQCQARGGTYESQAKSGAQTSRPFIVPVRILFFGSTGGAEGYASGYCIGPNPATETACFEQGQYPAPFVTASGCVATNEATRKSLLQFMHAAHMECDPKGQAIGTVTEPDLSLKAVCVAR